MADYENSNQIILFASKVMYKLSEEEEEEKKLLKNPVYCNQENVPFKAHVTRKISYFVLMSLSIKYK